MKALVVYFTESGCTRRVAQTIAEATGATLHELKAAEPYTAADLDWRDPGSRVNREANDPTERQSVKLEDTSVPDWDSYNVVFIGAPVWWGVAAWPIDDFLTSNDFTGKKLAAFVTSSSSSFGNESDVKDMAKGAQWLGGKRFPSSASDSAIRSWLESLTL
ncbi:flavodoxin [Pseudoscardovia radai]|uniref:Flavodoxin n=1 Tax=Pseudoscardovia radai TaxID=987066 RepID=A0A261EXC4_9BIFI|nr:flavodoxin [Pseudoscardovia radai]